MMPRQAWSDVMPHDVGLRVPVEKKNGRTASARADADPRFRSIDEAAGETVEHGLRLAHVAET
jgi:hypothetical protein